MTQNKDSHLGALLILAAVSLATNGYVLSTMWNWYAVAAFGAPTLSFKMTVGLCLLWVAIRWKPDSPEVDLEYIKKGVVDVVAKWMLLGLGWAVWSVL